MSWAGGMLPPAPPCSDRTGLTPRAPSGPGPHSHTSRARLPLIAQRHLAPCRRASHLHPYPRGGSLTPTDSGPLSSSCLMEMLPSVCEDGLMHCPVRRACAPSGPPFGEGRMDRSHLLEQHMKLTFAELCQLISMTERDIAYLESCGLIESLPAQEQKHKLLKQLQDMETDAFLLHNDGIDVASLEFKLELS